MRVLLTGASGFLGRQVLCQLVQQGIDWGRRPEYVLILPWNIATEVRQQNVAVNEWGGKFVIGIPKLEVSR